MNTKNKFFIVTTVPVSLKFFSGFLRELNKYYTVTAISSDENLLKTIGRNEGVSIKYIPFVRRISIANDFYTLLLLIKYFFCERPQLVHGNTPKAALLSMIAAWIAHVPVRVYMCHGLRYQNEKGIFKIILMKMEQLTCASSTRVICVSKGCREKLKEDGICDFDKSIVINYGSASGIDFKRFSEYNKRDVDVCLLKNKYNISEKDFVFIFIGRLVRDKGVNELISAFDLIDNDNVKLLLVGDFEDDCNVCEKTKCVIQENKNIIYVGYKNDIRPYLALSNALVLPSYREGLGMVIIEAGAMAIPSIASDIMGCNEVIVDGVTGALVKSKNVDLLLAKMEEWSRDKNRVNDLGEKAQIMMKEKFSNTKVWRKQIQEYQKLIAETIV